MTCQSVPLLNGFSGGPGESVNQLPIRQPSSCGLEADQGTQPWSRTAVRTRVGAVFGAARDTAVNQNILQLENHHKVEKKREP